MGIVQELEIQQDKSYKGYFSNVISFIKIIKISGLKTILLSLSIILLSIIFYNILSNSLGLPIWASIPCASLFLVLNIIASTICKRFRFVITLCLPQLASKQTRAFFLSLIFILLLNGPVSNIIYNSKHFAKSINCSREVFGKLPSSFANQTKAIFEVLKDFVSLLLFNKTNFYYISVL